MGIKLNVIISKTASGDGEYLQIMSEDMDVNVVLIAATIQVQDIRPKPEKKRK